MPTKQTPSAIQAMLRPTTVTPRHVPSRYTPRHVQCRGRVSIRYDDLTGLDNGLADIELDPALATMLCVNSLSESAQAASVRDLCEEAAVELSHSTLLDAHHGTLLVPVVIVAVHRPAPEAAPLDVTQAAYVGTVVMYACLDGTNPTQHDREEVSKLEHRVDCALRSQGFGLAASDFSQCVRVAGA